MRAANDERDAATKGGSSNVSLETVLHDAIPGMVVGLFAGGALSAAWSLWSRHSRPDWSTTLRFQPVAFDLDADLASAFLALQKYAAPIAKRDFMEAGRHADALLCLAKHVHLVNADEEEEVDWEDETGQSNDRLSAPRLAHRYARSLSLHLNLLIQRAKQRLVYNKIRELRLPLTLTEDEMLQHPELERRMKQVCQLLETTKRINELVSKHVRRITLAANDQFVSPATRGRNRRPLVVLPVRVPAANEP